MYRDDMEALQARLRTLQADLEAERWARASAQAATQAAHAAVDEVLLKLRRQGGGQAGAPFWRRHWSAAAVALIALVLGAVWMVQGRARQAENSARRTLLETQLSTMAQSMSGLEAESARMERCCLRMRPGPVRGPVSGVPGRRPWTTLSRAQIQAGMRAIRPAIQRCFDRYKVPGLASVRVKILRNRRVGTAQTVGMFRDTPTGACVQAAARRARFPLFMGEPITITYPFILR